MARILDFSELERAVQLAVQYLETEGIIIGDWHIERIPGRWDTLLLVHSDGSIQKVFLIRDNVSQTAADIMLILLRWHSKLSISNHGTYL